MGEYACRKAKFVRSLAREGHRPSHSIKSIIIVGTEYYCNYCKITMPEHFNKRHHGKQSPLVNRPEVKDLGTRLG